jgi:hypothetical protein
MQNEKWERKVKNLADWKKSIMGTKVRIGPYCHPRRRKRRNNLLYIFLGYTFLICGFFNAVSLIC